MKTFIGGSLALAAMAAFAQVPSGYAFERPSILARQVAWGHLHGVRLLAQACRDRDDTMATQAYVDWLDRQKLPIALVAADLSRYYFGIEAAPMDAIDMALNLKASLETPVTELAAACATLPQALASKRHDLDVLIDER